MHFNTIVEVAKLIQSKQISPVELTQMQLERIREWDPTLRSYATLMPERAVDMATQAEAEIMSGHYRGLLHGVPVAVKDLCNTRGVLTMGGAQTKADHVPDHNATVVQKLADAGTILLGKLNLTEGAMGGYNPVFPIPVNPWHSQRWTGSSSSGSGVATASGLCFGSLGSDTGGSIRFPAAACGVVGLKPTWGHVSRYGVLALAESMDHIGPMTRSVADAGLMLQAIAGSDSNDPTTLPYPVPDMLAKLGQELIGIRIGFDQYYATSDVDQELAVAVSNSVDVLVELGAELVEIKLPDIDSFVLAWPVLCAAEAVLAHQATYPLHRKAYGPWFRGWLDKGADVTGADYARANNLRAICNGHFQRAMSEIDILICPSMSAPPHPVTTEALYGPMIDRPPKFQKFTVPFNYNGMPTLSVPCGFTRDYLPLSLQLVGKHLSEPLLCQVGHAYERATTWHQHHPNLDCVSTVS